MPSTPSDKGRLALRAILDHALEAQGFLAGLSRDEFRIDGRTFHAVTRCLEIISEASRRLDENLKIAHPEIPWRDIADAGNLYRHDYDNVAADFVWKTATSDLIPLIDVARAGLDDESPHVAELDLTRQRDCGRDVDL